MNIVESVSWTKYVSGVPTYREKLVIGGVSTEDKGSLLEKNEGSTFTCTDNGDTYVWSGSGWSLVNAGSLAGTLENTVGNLPELDTDQKSSAVAAINEVYEDAKSTHYNRSVVLESDFTALTAGLAYCVPGVLGVAASSGTVATGTSEANHPGVVSISDSTTANGGYYYFAGINTIMIAGGEKAEFIFSLGAGAARTTAAIRMGFQDQSAIETAPTDGVWLDIVGDATKATISGKANNNTGVATTDTTFTAELATWYRGTIELNADATLATFSIRTCADGLSVWGNTLTTKIPTGAGRLTGWGIVAGETTTDASAVILNIDYANMSIDRTLVR